MASTCKSEPNSPPPQIPTPPRQYYPYDVFLSFRGVDTGHTFTDHLYTALVDSGIRTFRDDDELIPGGALDQELMKAIEESRIAIVVFSENYAASSWCLDELVRIIDRKKLDGSKIVLPVFYHVEPSDVRRQNGSFAKAFEKHQERESDKLDRWRSALTYAANLSGLDLKKFNGSESGLIKQIVKEVLDRGNIKTIFVAKHPVGLDSHLNAIIPSIINGMDDVRVIGICGMGGIGKTVIAAALYNETLRYFDSSCFLENIREVSALPNGLESLQDKLLYQLSMKRNRKVGSIREGITMIMRMFCFTKVLIVLDDLDNIEQANELGGCRDWFGPGSRIIITTRHQNLLHMVGVYKTYCPQELNYDESLQLFSLHSFETKSPPQAYAVHAKKFTDYCRGLPLALQVLGSYLKRKDISEWNSAFKELQQCQDDDIHGKLKISYDGLTDRNKEIFLDIAFFFIGMEVDYVTEILNGCGFSTTIGIRDLRDRCLITVNRNNELGMHDLLRDMGRDIIRRLFPKHPYKRSRLWTPTDVTEVVMRNKEAEAVEGVVLVSQTEEEIQLHTKTFWRMPNLRLLRLKKVNLKGNLVSISPKIRWICWQEYPVNYLPRKFGLKNIVALDMQHMKMDLVWTGIESLEHLKILILSHSKRLRSTPDFTKMQMLVKLILEGCISLLEIHPSIGNLGSLQFLNLEDCREIKTIPTEICKLKLLAYLNLNGCSKLEGLPENLGWIVTLRELSADETAIKQLPSSLGLLKNLTSLSLKGCNKKSAKLFLPRFISGLCALRRFDLRDCNLFDQEIPVDIGSLFALQELDLAGNNLSRLPESFKHLTNLESLYLDNWNALCSFPELPSSLRNLVPTIFRSQHVFLSFPGSDTTDTFTNNLYTALKELAEIHVYRDDDELVSHQLIPVIESSRIVIIVLSTNYVSSSWCLDNLVQIIECKQAKGKAVLPIFYNVDRTDIVSFQKGTNLLNSPSEEASQIGSFAEAFQIARSVGELDEVERWRSALSYTADLRGFRLQDFNGSESSLVDHIVKEVQWELKRLFVAYHPVGLESRLMKVRPLLQLESNELRVIGINGEAGSGKTVIAKALYNESLQHFDCSCFLADIKKVWALPDPDGLVYLQNQLLYQLGMGEINGKVESIGEGIEVIGKMCSHRKVLIVLDGLYGDEQADALLGNRNLYGPGSRIIFVGGQSWNWSYHFPRDATYITEGLNREESMELLSWHSFGTPTLPTDYDYYAMLTEEFKYSFDDGNPSAIVRLGTFLYGRSIHDWKCAVERSREIGILGKRDRDSPRFLGESDIYLLFP